MNPTRKRGRLWGVRTSALLRCVLLGVPLGGAACVTSERAVEPEDSPERLVEQGEQHADARRFEEASRAFQTAALATERPRERAQRCVHVSALAGAARVRALEGEREQAQLWLQRAQDAFDQLDPKQSGRLRAQADLILASGLYAQEFESEERALASFQELHELIAEEPALANRALQAAYLASQLSRGDAAIAWARKALEATEEHPTWRAAAWTHLGRLLDQRDRFPEALEAFEQARELELRFGLTAVRWKADWYYARALRKAGHLDAARRLLAALRDPLRERYLASREPADAEWLARWFFEQAHVERGDAQRIAASGREELAARLREASRRSATQARKLFWEAGAGQRAPELLAEVDAFLASAG